MTGRIVTRLAMMMALLFAAGCTGIPQDGRYQTHDGGRSNTRAEAPTGSSATRSS